MNSKARESVVLFGQAIAGHQPFAIRTGHVDVKHAGLAAGAKLQGDAKGGAVDREHPVFFPGDINAELRPGGDKPQLTVVNLQVDDVVFEGGVLITGLVTSKGSCEALP